MRLGSLFFLCVFLHFPLHLYSSFCFFTFQISFLAFFFRFIFGSFYIHNYDSDLHFERKKLLRVLVRVQYDFSITSRFGGGFSYLRSGSHGAYNHLLPIRRAWIYLLVCCSCRGEEKVVLLQLISSFGKDFATIAYCAGKRSQDLYQVFF